MKIPDEIIVVSTNISVKKGTIKTPVPLCELNEQGIINDAHSGLWHRQVSLLGKESIERFEKVLGRPIRYGEFAENITTSGYDLFKLKPGDQLINENIELEVTQIGKLCHGDGCEIFRQVGKCVMPTEGIFCRVMKKGIIKTGDKLIIRTI